MTNSRKIWTFFIFIDVFYSLRICSFSFVGRISFLPMWYSKNVIFFFSNSHSNYFVLSPAFISMIRTLLIFNWWSSIVFPVIRISSMYPISSWFSSFFRIWLICFWKIARALVNPNDKTTYSKVLYLVQNTVFHLSLFLIYI